MLKANLKYYCQEGKKAGLGKLAHQRAPFSIAELNLIMQSDHLDLYEPRGLVTLAMFLLATTMNIRIGREMRGIKFGDFAYVYNPDKTFAYLVYAPDKPRRIRGTTLLQRLLWPLKDLLIYV